MDNTIGCWVSERQRSVPQNGFFTVHFASVKRFIQLPSTVWRTVDHSSVLFIKILKKIALTNKELKSWNYHQINLFWKLVSHSLVHPFSFQNLMYCSYQIVFPFIGLCKRYSRISPPPLILIIEFYSLPFCTIIYSLDMFPHFYTASFRLRLMLSSFLLISVHFTTSRIIFFRVCHSWILLSYFLSLLLYSLLSTYILDPVSFFFLMIHCFDVSLSRIFGVEHFF